MSKLRLEKAREYIVSKEYDEARKVLLTMPENPTAKRWLQKLDEITRKTDPFALPTLEALPYTISDKGRRRLKVILTHDEEVLWAGHPDEHRFASKYTLASVSGILLTIVPVLGYERLIAADVSPYLITLISVIGIGILITLLLAYARLCEQVYAVTNRRLIIITRDRATFYVKRNITQFRVVPWAENVGDILFAEQERQVYSGRNRQKLVVLDIGMYGVHNYQAVRTLIYQVFGFGEDDFMDVVNPFDGLRPIMGF